MATAIDGEEVGIGERVLGWLNGSMAVVCALLAGYVALTAAVVLMLAVAIATGWPRGGVAVSMPWGAVQLVQPVVVTSNGPDSCRQAHGRRVCSHLTQTHVRPVEVDEGSAILGFSFTPMLLSLAALSYGLVRACACFVGLARRRWFARATVTRLRDFALGGLVFLVVGPAAPRLSKLLAEAGTAVLAPAQAASASFGGPDLGIVPTLLTGVYAVLLALITVVLAHARKVAEDHAQIV